MKSLHRYLFLILIINLSCFMISCKNSKKQNTIGYGKMPKADTIPVSQDSLYKISYNEILGMIEEKSPVSFKRAVFLLEWAYLNGKPDYQKFCTEITKHADNLKRFIRQKGIGQYRTAGNYALFEFFTKPNWMNGNKPYTYDFEDFTGREDYTKIFITKLMQTQTGQSRSLPIFYKILADEIGSEAYLAQAPNHLYIKHPGEDNRWVNIELTNGHFASDPYIISSMNISAEAIRNKIYMDAMSEKQNIAFLLYELGNGYENLYGYTPFVLQCYNKSLQYYPHNLPALMEKHNALRTIGLEYIKKNGEKTDEFLRANHKEFKVTQKKIEALGYREMTEQQYSKWLNDMEAEKNKQRTQNNTDSKL